MEERLFKITRGNEALDIGNAIRLANLRAQATNDPALIAAALPDFARLEQGLHAVLAVTRDDADRREIAAISTAASEYRTALQEIQRALVDLQTLAGRREAAGYAVLEEAAKIVGLGEANATDISASAVERVGTALTAIVFGIVAALVVAIVIALVLTRGITVPVAKGVRFAQQIALGELEIELDVDQKDEIGTLAVALREMLASLQYKAGLIELISKGDLTVDVRVASANDGLGNSLVRMVESLNEILGQVQVAVEQVAAGAAQVSSASQDLSQGATESASSLEEITSSINEISSQSRQNTDNSTEANGLSKQAAADAQAGQQQMSGLRAAMNSISDASKEITKVVKVIDDIAFQINLLALNANVEAARAGKYGKGFAVVAEEVRNLAVRSAEAVKETTAMVDQSVSSINTGSQLTEKTATQLEDIVGGAEKVAQFLEELAAASKEQSLAIEQITSGLGQVDQVTQSNTASAEESASAAEELSSQAEQLRSSISVFKLRNLGNGGPARGNGADVRGRPQQLAAPAKKSASIAVKAGGNGRKRQEAKSAIPLDDDFDRF